jgi:hypothetical protein
MKPFDAVENVLVGLIRSSLGSAKKDEEERLDMAVGGLRLRLKVT